MSSKQFDKTGVRVMAPVQPVTDQVRDRVRLFVAAQAEDAEDCAELLGALGLGFTPGEIEARLVDQDRPADTVIQAEEETGR